MYVLDYLSDPRCDKHPEAALTSEYRLLCSGTVHQDLVGDPYKSEGARILLHRPFSLFVVSRPLYDYPCELTLELSVPLVHESASFGGVSFHPDDEVASDVAALLSLLFRRLVTVSGKVRERHSGYQHPLFGNGSVPMPLATRMARVFWRPHPGVLVTSRDGQEYRDYNPPDKALDSRFLANMLVGLPHNEHSGSIVGACRLYALGMELLHDRPDIAYPTLISSVETLANAVLNDFQPDEAAKVQHKRAVYDSAVAFGLSEENARKLAIAACGGEYWATRKFKKFLIDNVADAVWTEPDELFHRMSTAILPKKEEFEQVLGHIYQARSKATHVGQPFPMSASYTGGPSIDARAAGSMYGTDRVFPPVAWFERIVHSALSGFWERVVTCRCPVPPDQ